jgi:hypothetical protein
LQAEKIRKPGEEKVPYQENKFVSAVYNILKMRTNRVNEMENPTIRERLIIFMK